MVVGRPRYRHQSYPSEPEAFVRAAPVPLGDTRISVVGVSPEDETVRAEPRVRLKSLWLKLSDGSIFFINVQPRAEIDRELEKDGLTYGREAAVYGRSLKDSDALMALEYKLKGELETRGVVEIDVPAYQRDRGGRFYNIRDGSTASIRILPAPVLARQ